MELRQLKTFRTVASLHSFNLAAKVLNYAQSTVSEQIKGLENDLNVRLFVRSGKYITLTEAGELLLQYVQRMLDIEEELKSEIKRTEKHHGALSIRIPETVSIYYLAPILKKFHEQYPRIRCGFNNCTYFSLQQEFQSGMTNLAFLITDENFQAPHLEIEPLTSILLVFVAHPDHPLTAKEKITVHDLRDETIILPQRDCSYRMMLERALTREKVIPNTIFDFNSLESIKKCIIAGTGITLISEIAAREEIQLGLLSVLPWNGEELNPKLLMIRRKDKWLSPALRDFMDMVREFVAT